MREEVKSLPSQPNRKTQRSIAFRQVDVTRALRATTAAGLQVASVTIDVEGKDYRIDGRSEEASPFPLGRLDCEPCAFVLEGINQVTKRLADGTAVTYW